MASFFGRFWSRGADPGDDAQRDVDPRSRITSEDPGVSSSVFEKLKAIPRTLSQLSARNLEKLGFPFADLVLLPPGAAIASVVINLFGLALPVAILQTYDRIIPNKATETLSAICLGLFAIVVVETLLRVARSYVVGSSAAQFGHYATVDAVAKILYAREGKITSEHSSKLIERIEAVGKVADFYGGNSRLLLIDLPFSFIFLIFIGLIAGPLVLVPMALIVFFGGATFYHAKKLRDTIERRDEHDTRTYDFVGETLRGILTLKSAAMEPFLIRRFERLVETTAGLNKEMIESTNRAQTMAGALGTAVTISMVVTGSLMAIYGDLTIGMLAACSQLAGRAIQPIVRSAGSWNEIQKVVIALHEASELFDAEAYTSEKKDIDYSRAPSISVTHSVGGTGEAIIASGQIAVFKGGDGSGKSSVLHAFSGISDVAHLTVEIDGYDPKVYRDNHRSAVGYVSPQTTVFRGSIMENLTLFGAGATVQRARYSCELLGLSNVINRLPEGFDTLVGNGVSETLPEGTIRQLLIARAVAQEPNLLLLDEPQAFLDSKADAILLETLLKLRGVMTIAIVTQRPSYYKICDQVIEVTRESFSAIGNGQQDTKTSAPTAQRSAVGVAS